MKFFLTLIVLSTYLFSSQVIECKDYFGKSKNLIGQTRSMNLMIKSLDGTNFPFKINKNNSLFAKMPSIEVLARNNIDLVVLWNSKGDLLNISNKLNTIGINTCSLNLDTISNYVESYKILGRLMNKEERALMLSNYVKEKVNLINKTREKIPENERLNVYHAKGEDGLLTNCKNSPHSELIEFVGAKNPIICNKMKKQRIKLNFEELLIQNPDVIITDNKGFYKKVYKSKKYKFLKAVKEKKVFMIPHNPINWMDNPPSFFKSLGALWLGSTIYPKYYDYDIKKEEEVFFALFLNKENI